MRFHVRRGAETDHAFLVAANLALARESEGRELDEATVRGGVHAVFAHPGLAVYWIVEVDERPAGCLMITTEWSDWRDGIYWWIQSVYVQPEHRGKGLFSALYEHVRLMALEQGGICGLRLYADSGNVRAQRTYRRLGMAETRYVVFEDSLRASQPYSAAD